MPMMLMASRCHALNFEAILLPQKLFFRLISDGYAVNEPHEALGCLSSPSTPVAVVLCSGAVRVCSDRSYHQVFDEVGRGSYQLRSKPEAPSWPDAPICSYRLTFLGRVRDTELVA